MVVAKYRPAIKIVLKLLECISKPGAEDPYNSVRQSEDDFG
jgi:hypothetical protein